DQRLDRRLSNTRLCPTYPYSGQPLVSTEVIIREPWPLCRGLPSESPRGRVLPRTRLRRTI
ncbi:MAG: hypothetical protein, partial [Olavius algarvensis Gamma 1 endosymbiont]